MKLFRIAAGALLASGLVAGSAVAPASAGERDTIDYVAFGDSYAAGFGAGSYIDACGQSALGYPGLLDERRRIELDANLACSGATALGDVPLQIGAAVQSGVLNRKTDLVTISAGGNDVGFLTVIGACASPAPADCENAVAAATSYAQTSLAANLPSVYAGIKANAGKAQIIVTGYPHLFSPEFGNAVPVAFGTFQGVLTSEAQQEFNDGTDALNKVIRKAAKAAGVKYVDLTKRFDGHGLGSPKPWFTAGTAPDGLHPNAEGYEDGYLHEIKDVIKD
ncbi:lysophospholipase L1-like esterase [Arthrobacter pigmenti]|uniref:Lysophospholipase L1-like esterase n=1 Tax=Arthrobacter pigmenti TaxID=271432 RepID=A0A846RS42_9MICC|nr:SGNH/GDSL hydrolase family protein [Arthrobacter pigmenti]NJC23372.1 lysophospholipase L1-like esterase [Arthrobacter pigmenti]